MVLDAARQVRHGLALDDVIKHVSQGGLAAGSESQEEGGTEDGLSLRLAHHHVQVP